VLVFHTDIGYQVRTGFWLDLAISRWFFNIDGQGIFVRLGLRKKTGTVESLKNDLVPMAIQRSASIRSMQKI
jgi:hypothetical protein